MTTGVDLVALERQGWQALADGRGGDYYRVSLADDALMALPFGVMGRDDAIAAMEQAPPWSTFELVDPRVVELTEDSAVVVYRANAQRAGQEPYSAMISSTFVRRDGRWLLAFHQQAPA
jgi:hypothetical protein